MNSKGIRLSETWFQRGLWLIAVLFAAFLIGLGDLVVGDLPKVEKPVDVEQFMNQGMLRSLRAALTADQQQLDDTRDALQRANLDAQHARAAYTSERESFAAWIATRAVTEQSSQNPEVLVRTHRLDGLKSAERNAVANAESLETTQTDVQQRKNALAKEEATLREAAQKQYGRAVRRMELRIFLIRLALTLPLLLMAVWLFLKYRKHPRWPFVWGFVFFALFTFFFELVPYMPSYGGYVRYLVGIVLTVWGGNYAIVALRHYLERQKAAERRPEEERRRDLGYEMAQARLARRVCPACERPIDTSDAAGNFCIHCGLRVFENCPRCTTRQTSFSHFCRYCGLFKQDAPREETLPPPPLTPNPV